MRIDMRSKKLRVAVGGLGFVALVAWLVPPTEPRTRASPLVAFAGVDSHRDDAARNSHATTTAYSAAAWKRWYAGQATTPVPAAPIIVPPAAPTRSASPPRPSSRDEEEYAEDAGWDERDDRQRWAERRREDDRLWRESRREDDRRWASDDQRWDQSADDRDYEDADAE